MAAGSIVPSSPHSNGPSNAFPTYFPQPGQQSMIFKLLEIYYMGDLYFSLSEGNVSIFACLGDT